MSIIRGLDKQSLFYWFVECWSCSFNYVDAIIYKPDHLRRFSVRHYDAAMEALDCDYEAYVIATSPEIWRAANKRLKEEDSMRF